MGCCQRQWSDGAMQLAGRGVMGSGVLRVTCGQDLSLDPQRGVPCIPDATASISMTLKPPWHPHAPLLPSVPPSPSRQPQPQCQSQPLLQCEPQHQLQRQRQPRCEPGQCHGDGIGWGCGACCGALQVQHRLGSTGLGSRCISAPWQRVSHQMWDTPWRGMWVGCLCSQTV